MADVPVLVCTAGTREGSTIAVPEGGLKIGRADDNDIVLDDDGVSRYHATLLFDNGSLWLQDAGSRNGVFVNGERLSGHRALKVGDVLSIAEHTFAVRWRSDVQETEGDEGKEPGRKRWFWPFSS